MTVGLRPPPAAVAGRPASSPASADAAAALLALRTLGAVHVLHAPDGTVVGCDDAVVGLFGRSGETLLGRSAAELWSGAVDGVGRPIAPDDLPPIVTLRTGEAVRRVEIGVRGADRRLVWLEVSSELLRPGDPSSECVVVCADVTKDRSRARALRTIRSANGSLLSATTKTELLSNLCRSLVDGGGYRLAWIGVASTDDHGRVDIAACWGDTEYLFDGIVSWSEGDPRGRGPVGTTIRRSRPFVVNDVTTDRDFAVWRETAETHGFASVATFPLTIDDQPAALAVYAGVAEAFDEDARLLLEGLAAQLAYGLVSLDRNDRLLASLDATISTINQLTEARDPYTVGHQRRVADLSVAIGIELGLAPAVIDGIRLGALVHDIGKIGLPAEILSKPGRLDPIEYQLVQRHCEIGGSILATGLLPWPVPQIARHHHERWDGSGYPDGLRGDEIELPARVVAVADVVEAIAHHRPYRPGRGIDAALEIVRNGAATEFDTNVVAACEDAFRHGFRFDEHCAAAPTTTS